MLGNRTTVKIPGKIMLAGEYSVLFGDPCLAATISDNMTIRTSKLKDGSGIIIDSKFWPEQVKIADIKDCDLATEPLIEAVLTGASKFDYTDFKIEVDMGLAVTGGFGTSSAVRLGALIGIHAAKKNAHLKNSEMIDDALMAYGQQKAKQQLASGYDFITQLNGGVLKLQPNLGPWPGTVDKISKDASGLNSWIHVVYCDQGDSTEVSVSRTLAWLKSMQKLQEFRATMKDVVEFMALYIGGQSSAVNFSKLINAIKSNRDIWAEFSGFPKDLAKAMQKLAGCDQSWTFKTTGAGGLDALLLFGHESALEEAFKVCKLLGWQRKKDCFCDQSLSISVGRNEEASV